MQFSWNIAHIIQASQLNPIISLVKGKGEGSLKTIGEFSKITSLHLNYDCKTIKLYINIVL